MTDDTSEDLMTKTLRWMEDNLEGADKAVYPVGDDKAGEHCTNSGRALITFVHRDPWQSALQGGPPRKEARQDRDYRRFSAFLNRVHA